MMGKHDPVQKAKTTPQRLAEYAEELHSRGIDNFRVVVEGRTLTFDFGAAEAKTAGAPAPVNPADLIDP